MSWLATTGSVTPYRPVRNVWASLTLLRPGQRRAASLRAVAPASRSLVTTAAGLAAANPACIFYNQFLQNIRDLGQRLDTFALEVSAQIEKTFKLGFRAS